MARMLATANYWIRVVLAGAWFFAVAAVALVRSWWQKDNSSLGHQFASPMARGALRLLGARVSVADASRLTDVQPCIYMGNHQSNLDVVVYGSLYPPRTIVIGKVELKRIPLFGRMFAAGRNIMIDRKNRTESIAGLDQAVSALREHGLSIWIFPEGRRSRGAGFLPFKKGGFHMAIAAQCPIVPIVSGATASLMDTRARRLGGGTVQVSVLEPISTVGLTSDDVEPLMQRTRDLMAAELERISRPG